MALRPCHAVGVYTAVVENKTEQERSIASIPFCVGFEDTILMVGLLKMQPWKADD